MTSRFTEQIYCICGDLDDIICEGSLRKITFNHYFAEYLKTREKFDYVVFYLASRGMRVYDDETAMSLIGANANFSEDMQEEVYQVPYEEDDEEGYENEEDTLTFEKPLPGKKTSEEDSTGEEAPAETKKKDRCEIVYFARMEVADFASLMDHLLRDFSKKSAIVFESLMDYMQLSSDDRTQFEATFQYFLSDSLDDNQNKVFFLAMNMDYNQIYAQIGTNDRLGGVFFQERTGNPVVRREKFIEFGKPMKDEIRNLLEHYRLYGYKGKYLCYSIADLDDYAYLLECYATKARSTSLNEINRVLQGMMDSCDQEYVKVTRELLENSYPRVREIEFPLESLSKMPYTEEVVKRLRVIMKYRQLEIQERNNCQIARFMKQESKVSKYGCRFLLKGIEKSSRTKTAIMIADFLYIIGEVFSRRHVIVGRDDIIKWTVSEIERTVAELIQKAENTVLILDDLDALTEMDDSRKLILRFHRCLLEELSRDRGIHLIMVVNTSKAHVVFTESDLEKYEIPEKNRLELSRESEKKAENDVYVNRGDVAGGR